MSTDTTTEATSNDKQARTGNSWVKQAIVYMLAFWIGVVAVLLLLRYPAIVGMVIVGDDDRALMAIKSADLDEDTLSVSFERSKPDQPIGLFIVSGHPPRNSNTSDEELENLLGDDTLTFNGKEYEIEFEALLPGCFPGRNPESVMEIEWVDGENGNIQIAPISQYVQNMVRSNRAFLVVAREPGDFRVAFITHE